MLITSMGSVVSTYRLMLRLKSLSSISSRSARWGEPVHLLEGVVGVGDLGDVFGVQEVARFARPEVAVLVGVDEQDPASPLSGLGLVEDADRYRDAGTGEQVGG